MYEVTGGNGILPRNTHRGISERTSGGRSSQHTRAPVVPLVGMAPRRAYPRDARPQQIRALNGKPERVGESRENHPPRLRRMVYREGIRGRRVVPPEKYRGCSPGGGTVE